MVRFFFNLHLALAILRCHNQNSEEPCTKLEYFVLLLSVTARRKQFPHKSQMINVSTPKAGETMGNGLGRPTVIWSDLTFLSLGSVTCLGCKCVVGNYCCSLWCIFNCPNVILQPSCGPVLKLISSLLWVKGLQHSLVLWCWPGVQVDLLFHSLHNGTNCCKVKASNGLCTQFQNLLQ